MNGCYISKDILTFRQWLSKGKRSEIEIKERIVTLAQARVERFTLGEASEDDGVIIQSFSALWDFVGEAFAMYTPCTTDGDIMQILLSNDATNISDRKFRIISAICLAKLDILPMELALKMIGSVLNPSRGDDYYYYSQALTLKIKKSALVAVAAAGVGVAIGFPTGNIIAGIVGAEAAVIINLLSEYMKNNRKYRDLTNEQTLLYAILSDGNYTVSEIAKRVSLMSESSIRNNLKELDSKELVEIKGKIHNENLWGRKG